MPLLFVMSAQTGPPWRSSIFAVLAGETATTSADPQTAAIIKSFFMLLPSYLSWKLACRLEPSLSRT
jgi:hypothetical protein